MRTKKFITLSPRKKYILFSLLAVAFIGFALYGAKSVVHLKGSLNSQQIRINNDKVKLKTNQAELETLNKQLNETKVKHQENDVKAKERIQKLEKENKDLEAELQAKIEAKERLARAARETLNKVTATPTVYAAAYSGSHTDWMSQAGISPSNFSYVEYIVSHESGWNPNAVNASSGACGLGQQLPCGKWAGAWNDPVAALRAMQGYAVGRYGSWAAAHSHWLSNAWW